MKRNNNIHLAPADTCTGCSACVSICPTNSITMREDKEGFMQPLIDADTCIKCHKCEKTCPIITPICIPTDFETQAYAAINQDEEVRMKSSSGGMFHALAKWTIEQGGVVFGARFDENWDVVHDYTDTIEGIEPFLRSKYVQSRIGDTFKQTKQFLNEGRQVLFVGTPCQIGGLKSYLAKEYDNLLAVDFICHGVPSPGVWRKYLTELKQRAEIIKDIIFRSKDNGWHSKTTNLTLVNKLNQEEVYIRSWYDSPYTIGFGDNIYLRKCCYDCSFKTIQRVGDLTIADAWGVDKYFPELDDNKGTSLIIIHSSKGLEVWKTINGIISQAIPLDSALGANRRATTSVPYNPYRTWFFRLNQYCTVQNSVRIIRTIVKYKSAIERKIGKMTKKLGIDNANR